MINCVKEVVYELKEACVNGVYSSIMKWLVEKFSKIVGAFAPNNRIEVLAEPITYLIKLHVDAFGEFGGDFVSSNSNCACIVTVDGRAFVWVAKVMENSAQHCTFPAIDKEGGRWLQQQV